MPALIEALDLHKSFGLVRAVDGVSLSVAAGEAYGLLIDRIGELLKLPHNGCEENPVNLDPRMAKLAGGVHRLDGQLMVVLDVDRVLEIVPDMLAA